ncbi:MAG: hypothetical protein OHK0039_38110 [Bacteroidia bacterium]
MRRCLLLLGLGLFATGILPAQTSYLRRIGEPSLYERGKDVHPLSDGGALVLADTRAMGPGDADIWLLRLGADDDTLWTRRYGSDGDDLGIRLLPAGQGDWLIAAATQGAGAGEQDLMVLRVDSLGQEQWRRTWGTANWETCVGLVRLGPDRFLLGGMTESPSTGEDPVFILFDGSGTTLRQYIDRNNYWGGGLLDLIDAPGGGAYYAVVDREFSGGRVRVFHLDSLLHTTELLYDGYSEGDVLRFVRSDGDRRYICSTGFLLDAIDIHRCDVDSVIRVASLKPGHAWPLFYLFDAVATPDSGMLLLYAQSVSDSTFLLKLGPDLDPQWLRPLDVPGRLWRLAAAAPGYLATGEMYNSATGSDVLFCRYDASGLSLGTYGYGRSGPANEEHPRAMARAADGDLFITGYALGDSLRQSLLLLRTDPAGHLRWRLDLETDAAGEGWDVAATPDGGAVVMGYRWAGTRELLIVKVGADGQLQWRRVIGGYTFPASRGAIQPTLDGGYAVVSSVALTTGGSGIYLLRLSAQGDSLQSRLVEPAYFTFGYGYDLTERPDGTLVIAGQARAPNTDYQAIWIHTSFTGQVLDWLVYPDPVAGSVALSVEQTAAGGFLLSGSVYDRGIHGFLMQIDAQGDLQWHRIYTGNALLECHFAGAVPSVQGAIMAFGSSDSTHIDRPSTPADRQDIVVRYMDSGQRLGSTRIPLGTCYAALPDGDGGWLLLCGDVAVGMADVLLYHIDTWGQLVQVSRPLAAHDAPLLYPNPSDGDFRLRWEAAPPGPWRCELLDAQGRVIDRRICTPQDAAWARSDLPPGLYFLRVAAGGTTHSIPWLRR